MSPYLPTDPEKFCKKCWGTGLLAIADECGRCKGTGVEPDVKPEDLLLRRGEDDYAELGGPYG